MKIKRIKRKKRANIFTTYFILFVSIFIISFAALGTALILLVNTYSLNEKTELLKENSSEIAAAISDLFIVNDMNPTYSYQKGIVCEQLETISNCIDADVFVCDVEGNVIFCKEQSGVAAQEAQSMVCAEHRAFRVEDALLQSVYENGSATARIDIKGESCYVVGTAIVAPNYVYQKADFSNRIIGLVFATVREGTTELVMNILKTFLIISLIVLAAAFLLIWIITRRMVTPLQEMSNAAKRFAVGDFSYRVHIKSNDELEDLGNAFNDMADALDKLEGSRRSFVANVSHELKTPMTSIAGFIDGILDGTIPRDKQDYYLKIVSDEIRRLSRLVVAMLNMSKMESGDMEMNRKRYNVSDQMIHILLTFEQKIEKKRIDIRGPESLGTHYVYADTDMIYQVIYNLLDNAVKFTNEDGFIRIAIRDIGDMTEVGIKNSGSGIQPEELKRIFERFYKVDKSRSLDAKGAGLGLYIVKTMVEMNGGKIRAESDGKSETEFLFTLPRNKTE